VHIGAARGRSLSPGHGRVARPDSPVFP
jgi:hypothetical protein